MCIFISPTSAANKSAEQHEEPSEQDSFNHLLYKVLRLTSEQVQDFNDWMEHLGIPNVHELIAQSYRMPHAYMNNDKIPSTTPGAEPPRDARDSGSARSRSMHLETSSSDRPKWSPTRSSTRYQDQISVKCTRRTLRMPSFTRAAHAQPSLSNFPRRDSNFGEWTRSRGTTLGERNFPTSPQNKITKLTHCSIYVPLRTISTPQTK